MIFMGHKRKGCVRPAMSKREWLDVLAACSFRCFYCAKILIEEDTTKDHLVPLFHKGCDCCGNVVSSCKRCNSMKKNKTVAEFLKMKPGLVDTSGEFYTRITLLEPIGEPANDPLLKEVRRMAERMAFPSVPSYKEPHPPSLCWKTRRRA
jgi:5-methylcytosine-specific restriction endonuclease McrA